MALDWDEDKEDALNFKFCDLDELKLQREDHEELVGLGDELMMEEGGGERNSNNDDPGGIEVIGDRIGGYDKETPPIDDVCPICFDSFTIPCRSNCGHWFCACCIMHFWTFRASTQPCKCPLCHTRIVNLKPQTCQPMIPPGDDDHEHVDALKKVHHYNRLYGRGSLVLGTFHRIRALCPIFIKRVFSVATNPDVLRCTYYVLRLVGLLLGLLYERWEFEFVPTGGLGIRRMFDIGATFLVVTMFLVGIGYPRVLGRGRAGRVGPDS